MVGFRGLVGKHGVVCLGGVLSAIGIIGGRRMLRLDSTIRGQGMSGLFRDIRYQGLIGKHGMVCLGGMLRVIRIGGVRRMIGLLGMSGVVCF